MVASRPDHCLHNVEGASLDGCLEEVGAESSHGCVRDFLITSGLLFLLQLQPQVSLSFFLSLLALLVLYLLFPLPLAFFAVGIQRAQTTVRNSHSHLIDTYPCQVFYAFVESSEQSS